MNTRPKSGKVITFYSHKGGSGRTLAVANVARRLAERVNPEGGRVLMIDWDITQPSLHWVFQGRLRPASLVVHNPRKDDVGAEPGLIDLAGELDRRTARFGSFNEQREEHAAAMMADLRPEQYVVDTDVPGLSLMTSGRLGSDYTQRANDIDWSGLFERSPYIYMALAARLAESYDYVLIDSAAGIGDAATTAAALMPEAIVYPFLPNRNSLDGLRSLESFLAYRRNSSDLRPLLVHPVPSRLALGVPEKRLAFRRGAEGETGYQPAFEAIFKSSYALPACDLSAYFDEVELVETQSMILDDEVFVSAASTPPCHLTADAYDAIARRVADAVLPWESARR